MGIDLVRLENLDWKEESGKKYMILGPYVTLQPLITNIN